MTHERATRAFYGSAFSFFLVSRFFDAPAPALIFFYLQ